MKPFGPEAQSCTRSANRFDRAVMLIAIATSTVGLGMIFALLADLQDKFQFPLWGLGLITASSFITSFAAYAWLSVYADRGYVRTMLISGAFLGGVSMLWIGLATELWELVVARALVGFGEGLLVPAARRMALGWSDRPGRELASMFAAGTAGFILGPVIGALLAESFSLATPFFVAAVLSFVMIPFLGRMTTSFTVEQVTVGSIFSLLRHPLVATGVLLSSAELVSVGVLEAVWARVLADLGASTTWIGVSFTVILTPIILLAPVGGRFADKYRPTRVGLIGVFLLVPVVYMYGVFTALLGLAALGAIQAGISAFIAPSAGAAVALGSPPDRIAQGQGLLEAFGFLSAAVGAGGAGWLYGALGAAGLFALSSMVVLVLCLATLLVGRSVVDVSSSAAIVDDAAPR